MPSYGATCRGQVEDTKRTIVATGTTEENCSCGVNQLCLSSSYSCDLSKIERRRVHCALRGKYSGRGILFWRILLQSLQNRLDGLYNRSREGVGVVESAGTEIEDYSQGLP